MSWLVFFLLIFKNHFNNVSCSINFFNQGTDQAFTVAHFLPTALSWPNIRLLSVLQASELFLPPGLSKHQKKWNVFPLGSPKIHLITVRHFFCLMPLVTSPRLSTSPPNILLTSAGCLLYLRNHFSVWIKCKQKKKGIWTTIIINTVENFVTSL